jgi:hypothetical protein
LNDVVRYTTEQLLGMSILYATSKEAARPLPVPGSSKAAPSSITMQGAKKDAKGGKMR